MTEFDRESLRLVASGAWDMLPHLCRKRAVLFYHQGRLLKAAFAYRWLPADSPASSKEDEYMRGSLTAILAAIAPPVTA